MSELTEIPGHVRPINFAAIELLLDLLHCARKIIGPVDLESILIFLCVSDATMRPFMLDQTTDAAVVRSARPADDLRGSISRRVIADKTGLSRETVRRKTLALAERDLLIIDAEDRVRAPYGLVDPGTWITLQEAHHAILRYFNRLEEFGVDPHGIVEEFLGFGMTENLSD